MPSILHILDVDNHVKEQHGQPKQKQGENGIDKMLSKAHGGMNWGTIAIYSCAMSCGESAHEYVIIQESGDGSWKKRTMKKIPDNDDAMAD